MEKKSKNFLFKCVILLYFLYNVPIIGYITPSYICLIIVLLLVYTTASYTGHKLGSFIFIALAICSCQLSRQLVMTSSLESWLYSLVQIVISLTIGLVVVERQDYRIARFILFTVLICYSITAVTTFYGNTVIEGASRILAASGDQYVNERSQFALLNIGGFSFIYILALWIPILIGMLKVPILPRYVTVLLIALFLATIYISEYSTALLVASASLFLLLMLIGRFNQKNIRRFIVTGIITFYLSLSLISSFLGKVSEMTESNLISGRFTELVDFMNDGGYAYTDYKSDLTIRKDLYTNSLNSFLENPLFGSLDVKGIGGHSLFFDSLGLFGIFGFALYVLMLIFTYKSYMRNIRKKSFFGFFFFTYVMSIVLTIVNPHLFLFFYSFILPSSLVCFNVKEANRN